MDYRTAPPDTRPLPGVFEALLEGLIAEAANPGEVDLPLVSIDSTTAQAPVQVHPGSVVTGCPHRPGDCPRGGEGQVEAGGSDEQIGPDSEDDPEREERRRLRRRRKLRLKAALLGRSRGGQTGKVHLAADRKCRPPAFVLMAGQAADSPQFIPVLKKVRVRGPVGRPRTRPGAVAGNKAHSSRGNRAHLRKRHVKAVIPEKEGPSRQPEEGGLQGRSARQP